MLIVKNIIQRQVTAESNLTIVQNMYQAYEKGNIDYVLEQLADNVDWKLHVPAAIPYSGQFIGVEQVAHFFTVQSNAIHINDFRVDAFIDGGNAITVQGWDRIQVKHTGRIFEMDWAHIYHMEDGKVIKFREYFDTYPLMKAFELL